MSWQDRLVVLLHFLNHHTCLSQYLSSCSRILDRRSGKVPQSPASENATPQLKQLLPPPRVAAACDGMTPWSVSARRRVMFSWLTKKKGKNERKVRVVPSRNWKTWNPEPRTWPGFETVFCSKTNPEKWCDDVTKSVPSSRKIVTFLEVLKKTFSKPGSVTSNLECDEMVTSHHFVTVPHSNPGPGSGKIPAWNDPESLVFHVKKNFLDLIGHR